MTWDEVWTQMVNAEIRFRSTMWANGRCVVLFQRPTSSNVRQFALTKRELLVLHRTLVGDSQKEIAAAQGLPASTIGASLKSAMLKLGFASQRHTAPIAALIWSHDPAHGARPYPQVYSVAQGESVLAATHEVEWSRVPQLTPSALEIIRLLIQGKPNQEIARIRRTSLHTVENQVHSLLKTAGARSRFDLMRYLFAPRSA